MGIKCSVFGHDFGETTVERDREEQGNEVVSTIREIETCTRCGEIRVVSENTEVTTIKTPDDVEIGDESVADEPEEGPEIVDAEAGDPVADTSTTGTSEDPPTYESAAADDGVILEDDSDEEPGRRPGEWPDETPTTESDGVDSSSAKGAVAPSEESDADGPARSGDVDPDEVGESSPDSGAVAPQPEEETGASILDEGLSPDDETTASQEADGAEVYSTDEDASVSAGEDVEMETSPPEEAEVWSRTDPDLGGRTASAEEIRERDVVADGDFRCAECGFTTPVASSSLREGDYCPECRQGMLEIVTQ